ncbi:MAG: GAF domain-containing protein [Anaerolineae bacterium]|nr:GAF domain-containing protein [Anaerolineae bacterium]
MQDGQGETAVRLDETRERTSETFDLQAWRERLVRYVMQAMAGIGLVPLFIASYYRYTQQRYEAIVGFWLAYGLVLMIAFARKLSYAFRIRAMLFLLYGLAVLDFLADGPAGGGRVILLTAVFVGAIFLGGRAGLYALVLALAINGLFAYLYITNALPEPSPIGFADFPRWASGLFVLAMLAGLVVVSVNYLIPRLIDAMSHSGRLMSELTESQKRLQELVMRQGTDLERRGMQLQAAAQLAREATGFQDVKQILNGMVRLISERFGFYQAGIFLLDKERQYAEMRAASSEGGHLLLARGYKQQVGVGIVGYVAQSGMARIALDVDEDTEFLSTPDLPDTRSEIALPLRAREGVIGVLDVQSVDARAFSDDDVLVLQTLADQIALVISNAQLIQQVELQVEAERQFYQQLSNRAWTDLIATATTPGFARNASGVFPAADIWRPRMEQAVQSGALTFDEQEAAAVSVPIRVRGQVVGVIDARKSGQGGAWTQDEIELLETLSAQLDPALDSAQLYQNSQLLAKREQVTREVASRMRETLDVDRVLQTAAREIGDVLGLADFVIRVGTSDQLLSRKVRVDAEPSSNAAGDRKGSA